MKGVLIVGIDMAKKDFAAAYRVGEVETARGKFANDTAGYGLLRDALLCVCKQQSLSQIQVILEATGGYEAALMTYAYEQEWGVSMPNPKQVCDWAKGVGYRVKTARAQGASAARILAHYGVERRPPLRSRLAAEVTRVPPGRDSLLKRRLDWEQALPKEQTHLSEMAGRPGIAPQVAESLHQVIEALTEALAGIQQAIDELSQSHEPFQCHRTHLLALPGVGAKVVLPLLVKLFQWRHLTGGEGDAQGLVAFLGLDPQPCESGRTVHKQPGISKMGDSELRRLLYMGALGGVRGNNPLKAFYHPLVGRGKTKKVALVAAARKILVWA